MARCAITPSTAVVMMNNQTQCKSLDQTGSARRNPDSYVGTSAQIMLDSSVLLLFRAFIHFEGY